MNETTRSSLALALQDYRGPRPGIAITIAAIALVTAIAVGALLFVMLGKTAAAIDEGRSTIRALHSYNAALEVWRKMATLPESEFRFPEQARVRDSIATALRGELVSFQEEVTDSVDKRLVGHILEDLNLTSEADSWGPELGARGRAAMIVLTARQDSAMFRAAARYQQSQLAAALVVGLGVLAAGVLIIPMSWLYVRYKRGQPLEL